MASNLDSHPKIRRAGRFGREVFLFALRRNAEPHHSTPGSIAIDEFEPWYLADVLQMPEPEAAQGLEACERAKLLRREGEAWAIVGWSDDEWGREKSTARVREWRKNQRVTGETGGETDETLRNVSATSGGVAKRSGNKVERFETLGNSKRRSEETERREDQDHRVTASGSTATNGETAGVAGDVSTGPVAEPEDGAGGDGVEGVKGPPARADARAARNAKPPPDPPVPALTTASVLLDYLLRNHPKSKLAKCTENQRETTLLRWAHDMRLMHEVDRREYGEIQAMIHWCQRDSFWSTVILSAGNLRDKFDTMNAQRKRKRAGGVAGAPDPTPDEVNARRMAEHKREEAERERLRTIAAGADADRVSVADALADAQRKLGIAPPAAQRLDAEPEPEEDEPDAD